MKYTLIMVSGRFGDFVVLGSGLLAECERERARLIKYYKSIGKPKPVLKIKINSVASPN